MNSHILFGSWVIPIQEINKIYKIEDHSIKIELKDKEKYELEFEDKYSRDIYFITIAEIFDPKGKDRYAKYEVRNYIRRIENEIEKINKKIGKILYNLKKGKE